MRCNRVCVCVCHIIPAAFIISLYSSGLGGERSCYMLYPPSPPPTPPSLCEYSSCHFLSYLTVFASQAPRSRFILKQEPFLEQRPPLRLAGVGGVRLLGVLETLQTVPESLGQRNPSEVRTGNVGIDRTFGLMSVCKFKSCFRNGGFSGTTAETIVSVSGVT